MAIRTDVSIDWDSSPRVLTVAAPSTEITLQDIVDTCRYFEMSLIGMDNDRLVDAGGKEYLGGTTYVGITATLNNAVLAFEARGGPSWTLCTISGGNLVSLDSDGNSIDPRLPTAYVSCDRTASSSATLQEQEALQYSSFDGAVTYDSSSSYSGTAFPIGTPLAPVNNLSDALSICTDRGFTTIRAIGDVMIDTGLDYSGMNIIGESISKSNIIVASDANVYEAEFYECTLSGVLDGEALVRDSSIGTLQYVNGIVEQCLLTTGTITLGGSKEAVFINCWCGSPLSFPIIDMGESGQDLSMRNYSGSVEIKNLTGSNAVSITLIAGKVILDDTVTSGTVYVCGNGVVEDTSGNRITTGTWNGGVDIDTRDLINTTDIVDGVWAGATGLSVLSDLSFIKKMTAGKWAISGGQMIFYDEDNITEVARFDLTYDALENPIARTRV